MPIKPNDLALTNSQAACLIALRHCKDSKSKIAIEAKLDLIKTATALGALARLGLAKQNRAKKWHATARGKTCHYETVPDRPRRNRCPSRKSYPHIAMVQSGKNWRGDDRSAPLDSSP